MCTVENDRLSALYRESKEREHKSIAKNLAVQSLAQVVKEPSANVRTYYQRLFQGIDCLQAEHQNINHPAPETMSGDYVDSRRRLFQGIGCLTIEHQKTMIIDYVNYRHALYGKDDESGPKPGNDGGSDPKPELSKEVFPAPPQDQIIAELAKQQKTEEVEKTAADAAEEGVKEIISELVVGIGSDQIKALIELFGDKLLQSELGEFTKWVTDYFGKVAKEQIKANTEPIRDRLVARFRRILSKNIDAESNPMADVLKAEVNALQPRTEELEKLHTYANSKLSFLFLDLSRKTQKARYKTKLTADNAGLLYEQIVGSDESVSSTLKSGMEQAKAAVERAKEVVEKTRTRLPEELLRKLLRMKEESPEIDIRESVRVPKESPKIDFRAPARR
jgi:hypothetical protein